MRLLEAVLPRDHDLYFIGDDHEGALAQHTSALDKTIARIAKDPRAYLIHLGDLCETLDVQHPYYDPRTLVKDETGNPLTAYYQTKNQAIRYLPVAQKMIASLDGNHEKRAEHVFPIIESFLERIGRQEVYGGYTCKVSIRDENGNLLYKVFAYHGRSLAESRAGSERQKEANRAEQLKRVLAPLAGDCAVMAMGHTHRLMAVKPIKRLYLTDDGKKIQQNYIQAVQNADYIDPDSRYYLNTGTFLRTQLLNIDTYGELRGYPPTKIGYPIVKVRNGIIQDAVEVEI